MKFSNLVYISLAGAAACSGMVFAFNKKVSSQIKKTSFFMEAMEAVRQHEGALYLLGHPIRDSQAGFAGLGLYFNNESDVKVKVSGPKSDGILFYKLMPQSDKKLSLSSIQLQIGKDDSKRLVIKKPLDEVTVKA